MTKLFFSLFMMVFASFLIFMGLSKVVDVMANHIGAHVNIEGHISMGTFKLLDESIRDLSEKERNIRIQEYKNAFGSDFALLQSSQVNFSSEQKQQLETKEVVVIDDVLNVDLKPNEEDLDDTKTLTFIFRKHLDSNLVWRIHLDTDVDVSLDNTETSMTIKSGKYFVGMFYVLEQRILEQNILEKSILEQKTLKQTLPTLSSEDIQKQLKEITPNFGLPLKLLKQNEFKPLFMDKPKLQEDFQQNKVVHLIQNSKDVVFFHAFPDEAHALQIGPIEIPWLIRNVVFIMILMILLSIATALFLWLWPLWSNLLKIKNTANEFGKGDYNARIHFRKRSALAPIAHAFNAMAERTQQSITTQKDLTNAVSHELRTPVARMRFALEMLEESDSEEDKLRYFKSLNTDIDDLDSLLEELLSYARFDRENTKLNLRLEKLTPWLSNSINKLMPLAKDKSLNYQIEGIGINESAYFEPRLMSRVLDNLVQNALRYASNTIEVTLSKDIEHYVLTVEDDGKGISKEDQKHIFDAFSRIDSSRDRATGGFGLGLAIVDRIIKAHQGSIEIKKSHMGGALFEARWPINHELIEYLKIPPPYF